MRPISAQFRASLLVATIAMAMGNVGNSRAADDGPPPVQPLAIVLVPHTGKEPSDQRVREAQALFKTGRMPVAALERLGWAYVSKARETFDDGFLRLAELTADSIDAIAPETPEALLLRGHVLQNYHRFSEGEAVARKLVTLRGISYDHILLGDCLMEQGKLDEAIVAYQRAINLKPDLQSYSRAAWMRWLTGDLDGAIEALELAIGSASPSEPAVYAWLLTRMAGFQVLAGNPERAKGMLESALDVAPDYPPALLALGRHQLAENDPSAIPTLERALAGNPLPEYQWALVDAYRVFNRPEDADRVVADLRTDADRSDARAASLFLATTGGDPQKAVELAERDLEVRKDVLAHATLAWALHRAGRTSEALEHLDQALAHQTEDARLFLHAGLIFRAAGDNAAAKDHLEAAASLPHALLPSERSLLRNFTEPLASASETSSSQGNPTR